MKIERVKNSKRNIFWGIINKFVTLLCPFILRTLMLNILGVEYLGLNSLFSSILHVLNLAELGFSNAIIFSMYKPIADGDKEIICALLNLYKKIYHRVGTVILAIGLAIMPFLNYLISGEYPDHLNLYFLYFLYLINTVLSYFLFAYKKALLNAYQRRDIELNINSVFNLLMYFFQITILLVLEDYYIYLLAMPVFTILINLTSSYIIDKMYPMYSCHGILDKSFIDGLKKKVYGLMLNKICQVFRNSLDNIVISAFLGLVVLAKYQNYYYIINAVIGVMIVLTNAITAGVGNSIIVESVKKNYDDLIRFNFLYMWLTGLATTCFLCLFQQFIIIWLSEDYLLPMPVVVMLCVYFYAAKLGDVGYVYREATGLWWEDRYRPIVESISNLVLNILLVRFIGLYGVMLSTIITLVLINFIWSSKILFKVYFKLSFMEYIKLNVKYMITTVISCVCAYTTSLLFSKQGILNFICKGVTCVIVSNIVFFLIYFRSKEFKSAMVLIKKVL